MTARMTGRMTGRDREAVRVEGPRGQSGQRPVLRRA
ncbi:hypothetical protein JOF41_002396 [Saccharothrix coeruleofusca]|nr:hypothetical protein [Saccharothrix coeruleofusca]